MLKKLREDRQGVTLMELLVVVAVIGIITSIGAPNLIRWIRLGNLKSAAMNLLAGARETRSQAMANGREFEFTLGTNADGEWTYTRTRLPFKQINVLKLPIEEYLFEETIEELNGINTSSDNYQVPFFTGNLSGFSVTPTPAAASFKVTFSAAGTAVIAETAQAVVTLSRGSEMSYTITFYKGGQITFQ